MFHARFQNTSPYDLTSRRFDTKKRPKRRGVSPKLYPRKLLITEEKVAADLCNLCLNETWQSSEHQTKLLGRRNRTVSEIEESLELSSDEENNSEALRITISEEFQQDIKSFKKDFFLSSTKKIELPPTIRSDYSTALVLWKPPSGVIPDIMKNLPPKPEVKVDAHPQNQMVLEEATADNFKLLKDSMILNDTFAFTSYTDNFQYKKSFVNEFDDDNMEL